MHIHRIKSKKEFKEFVSFQKSFYKGDVNFIPPFEDDLYKLYSESLKNGNYAFFILRNQNKVIGRIAAFYPVEKGGGLGYFECIQDRNASLMLINAGMGWLEQFECKEVKMLVNPKGRDSGWGISRKRNGSPVYGENHHMPYYFDLLYASDWTIDFRMFTYGVKLNSFEPEIWRNFANRSGQNGFSYSKLEINNLNSQLEDVKKIYDLAWSHQPFFTPLNIESFREEVSRNLWFWKNAVISLAYNNGEPVGMLICIPDLNEILYKLNRGRGIINKIRLRFLIQNKAFKKLKGLLFGISPQYQKSSVLPGLICHFYDQVIGQRHIENIELHWIGDFNKPMLNLMHKIGAKQMRTHVVLKHLKKNEDSLE